MLEQISWKDFLIAIGSGCAAYYGILAVAGKIRFDRQRSNNNPPPAYPGRKAMTSSHMPLPSTGLAEKSEPITETTEENEQADDPEFAALELLADEVQVIITQFGTSPGSKEELLGELRKEIARYPTLSQPAFQRAISNLIIKVAHEECQLTISEEEARECWPAE